MLRLAIAQSAEDFVLAAKRNGLRAGQVGLRAQT
jgi:hypothetical protein